jgi:hypothetical protein
MKIEFNKDEYLNLLMGLHSYQRILKDDLKNNANYLYGYDGKISEKTTNEMQTVIRNLDILMGKLIKKRNEELTNEKI